MMNDDDQSKFSLEYNAQLVKLENRKLKSKRTRVYSTLVCLDDFSDFDTCTFMNFWLHTSIDGERFCARASHIFN